MESDDAHHPEPGAVDESTQPVEPNAGACMSFGGSLLCSIGAGAVAGLVAGLVWGGIGGRIAMRIVMLTSNDGVRGITSDDGFEIGVFTGETAALIIGMSVAGAVLGVVLGAARMFLPGSTAVVAAGLGVATALSAGAGIVHSDGVDFVFLDPLWLTVGLFVALPGAWAVSLVYLSEWLLAPGRLVDRPQHGAVRLPWGAASWVAVGLLAVAGGVDLVGDLRDLIEIRN